MTFRFRPVLTIATLIALSILMSLGFWQLQRLQWKEQLIDLVETRISSEPIPFIEAAAREEASEEMEYTPVSIEGVYIDAPTVRIFGMLEGEPGYYLFQAFAPSENVTFPTAKVIYVNRGYAPQGIEVSNLLAPPYKPMVVAGLFRTREKLAPPASWFRSTEMTPDGYWFVRDPIAFAAAADFEAAAYYIDSFAIEGVQWPKGGTTRLDFSNRHLEYALTWFGLAGALVGVFLFFSVRRNEKRG